MYSSMIQTLTVAASLAAYSVDATAIRRSVNKLTQGTTWTLEAWGYEDTSNGYMIDIDLQTKSKDYVKSLVDGGQYVVCYFSAGTAEDWRPDYLDMMEYASKDSRYPGEYWMDITQWKSFKHLIKARMEEAVKKGCHGIEPDNTDAYEYGSDAVPGETKDSLKPYQIEYMRWMANTAHELGLEIAQKNTVDLIPDLIDVMDYAINESCAKFSKNAYCSNYEAFVKQDKAVFGVEYNTNGDCSDAQAEGIMRKYKHSNGKQWVDCKISTN
ncbi:hypothetical protein SARC_11344 [Sphaeroforma arctica JP610]|uniref:Glycoside-hydrolase family GH114 TIM-barrel domain-containing protein n=1 Tax=Sphaeroforma arctica JP610 TaxID=667725 RepID=A0A0L0FHA1_9EUKA|nr:hypothetical protein SARC_11344 [Sphaeroforma arctica JP610]KNC76147.1 hypothetical protein SARC_11344 [Sphaeroforma arctica JP610]|eukprot:XP_014150049.1 hypothetical protein SARC_11344 [Sphaeroforma arctica JP610]